MILKTLLVSFSEFEIIIEQKNGWMGEVEGVYVHLLLMKIYLL